MNDILTIHQGDCLEVLKTLPGESVHCCVTSPPYWGLRDYGVEGQIGLEKTPEAYVARIVEVFREVRRVLRDDGTLWLNLGDSYARMQEGNVPQSKNLKCQPPIMSGRVKNAGMKAKDLVGIPWMVAFALRADGWYLRSDIIWNKPNPMPESVTDRPTKSHEYIFLLSKSARYFYDAEVIKENSIRIGDTQTFGGSKARAGQSNGGDPRNGHRSDANSQWGKDFQTKDTRNKRSVWTVATNPFTEAHFATFPPDLIKPCILAGCPQGGTVLDPFAGSGTTGKVAIELGRKAVLIELNPEYVKMIDRRCTTTIGLPFVVNDAA